MPTEGYLVDYASSNYKYAPLSLLFLFARILLTLAVIPLSLESTGTGTYTYYMRKHNGPIIHDAISSTSSRAHRIRNFNDFAADVNASALPQWIFVTPNMVNDGHDTSIDYTSRWLEYWLVPLLDNPDFNGGAGSSGTLVVLTFDENAVRCLYSLLHFILMPWLELCR